MYIVIFIASFVFQAQAYDHTHKDLTDLLQKVVIYTGQDDAASVVNYKKLQKEPVLLNKYIKEMSQVSQKQFDTFSKKQQMAFLINAYNVFTLKLINDHYPVKSIKKIGGFFGSPWKIKFIRLLGKEMHLDNIEHDTLRKNYNEPRIHFAVNCASIGCPRLRNEAFTADNLETQLEEQTKVFMRDATRNKIDVASKKLKLSKIFDWFEEDFKKGASKSVQAFIAPYISDDPAVQASLKKKEYTIEHLSYDWDLNEKK